MKRLLTAACVLVGLTGLAAAQTSTAPTKSSSGSQSTQSDKSTGTTPDKSGGTTSDKSAGTTSQAALRRVEGAALVLSFYTADPADTRATKLIGTDVYNLNGEEIGEVEDLIIDDGKTIKAIVVSVGGFLGMGERNVAILPGSIVMSEQLDGSFRLVANATKENLKKVEPFDFADVDKPGPDAGKTADDASAKK